MSDSAAWTAAIVAGLPGTGKSTMCRALAPLPSLWHVEAGEMFRKLDPDSDAGRTALPYVERGELVPDRLVIDVWREHVRRQRDAGAFDPAAHTLLLDGIPRTVEQARAIRQDVRVRAVIFLDVDDDVLVERLLHRGEDSGRSDDADAAIVRRRIETHRAEVLPMLETYPDAARRRIDAGRPPLAVLADVARAAAELLA